MHHGLKDRKRDFGRTQVIWNIFNHPQRSAGSLHKFQ